MTSVWDFYASVRVFKRELIERAVAHSNGNRTAAAALLGLQRTHLLRLARELGCQLPPGRPFGRVPR